MRHTAVGYTGGGNPKPTYDSVCDGDGHTEALRVEYDPAQTSFEDLLEFYWRNYHGSSSIPQYKAAIWYHSEDQKLAAEASLEAAAKAQPGKKRPVVDVLPAGEWHDAEEYHQKYYYKSRQRRMPPSFPKG